MTGTDGDKWSEWLLERRHGGDPEEQQRVRNTLYPIRDRVLDNADLHENMTLLDVGTGDGLIAFGALDRMDESSRVIFNDISEDLLDHSRSLVRERGTGDRCDFHCAPAQDLSLDRASVDAVTTRSVLIYIEEKQRAFSEFYRVLKPGGRLSIFEPINRFGWSDSSDQLFGYDVTPIKEIADKVREEFYRQQPPESNPMLTFDERDLFTFAEEAGFDEISLTFEANRTPGEPHDWETTINIAPNPNAPTLKEVIDEALTSEETEQFINYMRPLVESETDQPPQRSANMYLQAMKDGENS